MRSFSAREQKARLRRELRRERNSLSPASAKQSARQLCRTLLSHSRLQRSRNIAFYLSADGELDLAPLMQACHRAGKILWLPCISNERIMSFRRHRPGKPLLRNRFGIGEPPPAAMRCDPMQLDLVLMPLVAFDAHGNRLGMGGGFYDRAFARCRRSRRPFLMGVAHSFQQVPALPRDPWDIPVAAVATEAGIHYFRG